MKTTFLWLLLCLLMNSAAADLSNVHKLRINGNGYVSAKQYDSAAACFEKIAEDSIYSNATDHLLLSGCYLQLKDTVRFKTSLLAGIEIGGADSAIIQTYFRRLEQDDLVYFKQYFRESFPAARKLFLSTIDTSVQKEMEDIQFLDQLVRQQGFSEENLPHLKKIGAYIDSVNFVRVKKLIDEKRYPGFHNFGIMSSRYDQILMHISDHNDEQWNFIFEFLKREVIAGNITPTQVVTIATRHYGNNRNCTYYGSTKRGANELCDCKNVDKYRAEIGLDNLLSEYTRLKMKIPECYSSQKIAEQ